MTSDDDRRRLRGWAIAGIAAVLLGAVAVALTYTPLFAAREIRLTGTGALSRATVLRLAGLADGANVFHLDTVAVERRLERDPRILDARVTPDLPGSLSIRIVRRRPVAVVGNPASFVGADGIVMGAVGRSTDLPSVTITGGFPATGEDLAAGASAAAAMSHTLRRDVDTILVDPDGSLEVRLSLGFWADLGEPEELAAKAASLSALLRWARTEGVTIVSVDVSVPGSPTAELQRGGTAVPSP
jgi:cell division protein FtsQ